MLLKLCFGLFQQINVYKENSKVAVASALKHIFLPKYQHSLGAWGEIRSWEHWEGAQLHNFSWKPLCGLHSYVHPRDQCVCSPHRFIRLFFKIGWKDSGTDLDVTGRPALLTEIEMGSLRSDNGSWGTWRRILLGRHQSWVSWPLVPQISWKFLLYM